MTSNKHFYSEKEFAMIQACSLHWASLIKKGVSLTSIPPQVLDMVAMECFLENKRGPAVDSLRRCVNALKNSKMYRGTPEYDALISFEPNNLADEIQDGFARIWNLRNKIQT